MVVAERKIHGEGETTRRRARDGTCSAFHDQLVLHCAFLPRKNLSAKANRVNTYVPVYKSCKPFIAPESDRGQGTRYTNDALSYVRCTTKEREEKEKEKLKGM